MKSRASAAVKTGRFIQRYYHLFSFLDKIFIQTKTDSVPVICIVAPPRSGSTLTYQILTQALQNFHLTNFSNLLYATPTLSFKLQNKLCQNYLSSFSSAHGFVPGFCGEAEGLKFWQYWMGQGLQQTKKLETKKLHRLHRRLAKVTDKPFITGYLGHPFAIEAIRKEFDNVVFVHLQRDLLSNAYSLYKFYGDKKGLTSAAPSKCLNKVYKDKYTMVVDQIQTIHKVIEDQKQDDFVNIAYEKLCADPNAEIQKIYEKARQRGIKVQIKRQLPSFRASKVKHDLNSDTKAIDRVIKAGNL